ncbi:putative invertase inhibitor [Rhodamnia argentea]|uniref:Invertase inhibitor n=1 Tax=Rhodamnia argentea TaxID=178133 RepID=A0A8B8PGP9_9MYRT|nr:putative invertase inhibitor [Rhodamnia argentea]
MTEKMQDPSLFSRASCCCLFSLLTLLATTHLAVSAKTMDIISLTCEKCSRESPVLNYTFCSVSLQAVPVSHFTNLQGLGIISMELALVNATTTISSIEKMVSNGSLDPFQLDCLRDCLVLYLDASKTLVDAIGAFMVGRYGVANMQVSAAMEAATTCEDGFEEREEVCPLTMENYDLFQLCDIARCIIRFLSLNIPS